MYINEIVHTIYTNQVRIGRLEQHNSRSQLGGIKDLWSTYRISNVKKISLSPLCIPKVDNKSITFLIFPFFVQREKT